MRQIDKPARRDCFDRYTRNYLHASATGKGFYPKLEDRAAYSCFSARRWKSLPLNAEDTWNGWLSILMDESDGLCCYCMRRLNPSDVSVEHLIPESFDRLSEADETAFYQQHAPYLRDNVMTGREFDLLASAGGVDIDTHVHIPHLIAHANLFPACDSKKGCSCNNHRHNFRILPMMLMADVAQWTAYTQEGKFLLVHPDIDASLATIEHLDINAETLIRIRRLWYLFSRNKICPEDRPGYTLLEKDTLLRQAFGLSETDIIPDGYREFLDKDEYYWNLLLKYDWFYTYYLNCYPVNIDKK